VKATAEAMRQTTGREPHDLPFEAWLAHFIETPERRPFTFEGRPWLPELARAAVTLPNIVVEKASQLGATILFLCASFYLMARRELPAGVVYFFPTDGDVRELSKTKAFPLLDRSYLRGLVAGRADEVYLKRIADSWLYFRGTHSTIRMKAISADVANFDEADEIPAEALAMARERIHASKLQWERHFSIPTVPNYGVDRSFQATDQRFWTFRCAACSKEFDLETHFPNSLTVAKDGTVLRCCPACKHPVALDDGRWIARNPGARGAGFHLSQLLSPTVEPADLLREYTSTDRVPQFMRGRLGLPYVEASGKLSEGEVLDLCGAVERANTAERAFVGIDVGRVLHWVAVVNDGAVRVIGMGEEPTFEAMERRLRELNCEKFVVDALPETHYAIQLAERFRGIGWLNYYTASKQPPRWTEDEARNFLRVDCNRTEQLDRLFGAVKGGKIVLPRRDALSEEYAKHLSNLIRTNDEDESTGEIEYLYVKTGPDHYAHATLYAMLAAGEWTGPIRSLVFRL